MSEVMRCIECPYKYSVQRKCGVTWHCSKEVTQMDVTYYMHKESMHQYNSLCPLRERYICKYCEHCGVYDENYDGVTTCYLDIGEHVNVNDIACDFFRYDDVFPRC